MKTSKPPLKKSDQGKCGVWLDTAELKGKAKQKRLARPISKLLNPFLEGGGYSVAVALNFTQTKLEMPKTKQSSIRSFFAPQPKDVKMMPASDNVVTPSASASRSPATGGTKRSRDEDLDASSSEPTWVHNLEGETVDEEEFWRVQTENHTPAPNKNSEEMIHSPQSKRRVFANSSMLDGDEPHLRAWSQDPLFTFSEYSQGESNLKEQNNYTVKDIIHSESRFFNGFQREEAWGVAATTSTQKSLKHTNSSFLDDDKENAMFAPLKSPNKHRTSNLKHAHSPSTPNSIPVHPQEKAPREESQLTWTKPSSSPVRRSQLSRKADDEDSLAVLFTQDSEGFRVIAHGGRRGRSPLKDHSNANAGVWRMSARKSLEEEEEEMLFTQDSQGNVVIKH